MIPITRPVRAWARSGDSGTADGLNIGRALCCSSGPLCSSRHQVSSRASRLPSAARGRSWGRPYTPPAITVSQRAAFANGVRLRDWPGSAIALLPVLSSSPGLYGAFLMIGQVIGPSRGQSTLAGISRVRYAGESVWCMFIPWQVPMAMVRGHFRSDDSDLKPLVTLTPPSGSASSGYGCASCAPASG
jgi:hypothetical protein